MTTTSFESSTTTTTTTTTDNNTDAGGGSDGRAAAAACPVTSTALPAANAVAGSREGGAAADTSGADGRRRQPSSSARQNCADVAADAVEPASLDSAAAAAECPGSGVAASLRSAARKRRDFRNERTSAHRLALDRDDLQSSTDQPSGDSVDGGSCPRSPGGRLAFTGRAAADSNHASRCAPSSALRRFLSYQLSSHSSAHRSFRCRHDGSRDYRSVTLC